MTSIHVEPMHATPARMHPAHVKTAPAGAVDLPRQRASMPARPRYIFTTSVPAGGVNWNSVAGSEGLG